MHLTTFVNILPKLRYFEGRNYIQIDYKSYSVLLLSRQSYERWGHLGFLERGVNLEKGGMTPLTNYGINWVWNAFFVRGSYSIWWSCDIKKAKLVASERKWWLCLIRFLKFSYTLWIFNAIVYFQYLNKFSFLTRMDLDITCKDCYLCFISAVLNFWSYVWFYLSQNWRGRPHSPLTPKVLLERNYELTGIKLACK